MTLAVELAPAPDPLAACARFTGLPHLIFLDSSARGALGRYSFLTADPVALVGNDSDLLTGARTLLAPYARAPLPDLPPFQGGIAGYHLERGGRGGRAWIVAWGPERLAWVGERLSAPADAHRAGTRLPPPWSVTSNFTRREYEAGVAKIRDYIAAGDVYQVNLAQRFRTPFTGAPLELYRRLRARSPAPFGAYLALGDVTIASISPERFLRLDAATRAAEARPIKGTRPRGATPAEDAALAQALAASDKDRAENVMIVDLLRNDLGKVCRPGSVHVPELWTGLTRSTSCGPRSPEAPSRVRRRSGRCRSSRSWSARRGESTAARSATSRPRAPWT